ncbi:flagellar hook-associated protein FlgL [Janthinobacterium fluminis]|uniref:Flagellar hook-associated protein FlgL n=1 Tax=Janthinobacterium fluminis TaxID=2987524 RepID=A0ABT5JUT1_9BURK|nr:flagellar hook-associated protein FlgL [Janthinobacterium fluminis]MDC8756474.1 flagellar hook-associated protein FlgL [Janthinobacterium fluminis]
MRVATSQFQTLINTSIQTNQERISYLTQQMASGMRIQLPSDDPISSVRVSRLTREQSIVEQYIDNIASVKTRLMKNETSLSSIVGDFGEIRDMLVWAANGTNAPADLNAMTTSLTAYRDSIFYTANLKDQEGRFMFSGTATNTAPLVLAAGTYTYAGNTDTQTVVVGNGVNQAANVDVSGLETSLNKLTLAINALTAPGVNPNDPAVRALVIDAMNGTDTAMDNMSSKIATFGGAQNILTTLQNNHENVSLSNKIARSDIQKADMAEGMTELNGYQLALQATYKAYAKIGNMSLFDVI